MTEDDQGRLVDLLVGLRREGRQQSGLDPALVPPDKDTAYRIAGRVALALAWPVVGWKIAAAKPALQATLRTDSPIYGRVFQRPAGGVRPTPLVVEHARQCSPIPEVEYQAVLGADLPPRRTPWRQEEVAEAVAFLHPGIELAECRFIHDAQFPPLTAILADGAGSGSICLGPSIPDWRRRDIAGQRVVLLRNGEPVRAGSAAEALDDPLVPLTWLANELSRTGVGLWAGQTISTGTLTGMLRPRAGDHFVADFGPFGQVSVHYV